MSRQIGHLPRQIVQKVAPYLVSGSRQTTLIDSTLTATQDSGDIVIEASLSGYKGSFDCPIRLAFYGPSNQRDRARIEQKLKADKLIKATELTHTRKEAEARRTMMGLTAGRSTHGFGTDGIHEPEVSLEDIMKKSQSVELGSGADAIKPFAMDEKYLSEMPSCEQPAALKATLLPYQLQVCVFIEQFYCRWLMFC